MAKKVYTHVCFSCNVFIKLYLHSVYISTSLNLLSDRKFSLLNRAFVFGVNAVAVVAESLTDGVGLKNHFAFLINLEAKNIFSGW